MVNDSGPGEVTKKVCLLIECVQKKITLVIFDNHYQILALYNVPGYKPMPLTCTCT